MANDDIPEDVLADMDAYYAGELSPAEVNRLRERLTTDPELARAAARYEAWHRHAFRPTVAERSQRAEWREELHRLEAELPPLEITRERHLWPRWAAAAAVVLLLLLAGWYLLDGTSPEARLAQENFDWLPRNEALLGPGDDAKNGLIAYDQQEYDVALPLLREGVTNGVLDSVNLIYAGVSALAVGEPATARALLTEVLESGRYPYDEPNIRYYLGLAELELGNRAAARRELLRAREQQAEYADRAADILERLSANE